MVQATEPMEHCMPPGNGWDDAVDAAARGESLLPYTVVGVMAHNEAAMIRVVLESLLAENDRGRTVAEIVVVASGCTDGTDDVVAEVADRDPRVRLLREERRTGKASAINWFLRETAQPICVVVGGDTLLKPGALTHLVQGLLEPEVAMTGPRIVPTNARRRGVGRLVHLLWDLHHHVSVHHPKLGEAVAFRRVFEEIDETTLTDEVSIESIVSAAGDRLLYVPEAIVYNYGPETLRDYLRQRERIHRGHLGVHTATGYRPATMRTGLLARAAAGVMIRRPGAVLLVVLAVILEVVARTRGWVRHRLSRGAADGIWRPISTSKRPFVVQGAAPDESAADVTTLEPSPASLILLHADEELGSAAV